jgi:hypothetical protein
MKKANKKLLIFTLIVYVISSVVSFGAFSYFSDDQISLGRIVDENGFEDEETRLGALLNIDPNEPKDQVCPLNGKYFTKTEKEAWEQRRPLAVMIENSPDARPQSGLSDADMVFEIMAEGGVTRFMAMFYCGAQRYDTTIAPVRSSRTYFVNYASGFNFPLYVNVGGSNLPGPTDSLGQIQQYGWGLQNNISQFSVGYPTFVRNANRLGRPVATEHTMETTSEKLWGVAEGRKWTNIAPVRTLGGQRVGGDDWKDGYTVWQYQDEPKSVGDVDKIVYDFWNGYSQYTSEWNYDSETNSYARVMGGEPHVDQNTGDQIKANNVIVLFTVERGPLNELKHMLYTTEGTGNALIFRNGEVVRASWSKPTRTSELTFTDRNGGPIEFARGLTWISVLRNGADVDF